MFALKFNVESCKECPFAELYPNCGTGGQYGFSLCKAIWSYLKWDGKDWVPCAEEEQEALGVWDPDYGWFTMGPGLDDYLVPTGGIAPGEIDP